MSRFSFSNARWSALVASLVVGLSGSAQAGTMAPGNLVVLRVGDGSAALGSNVATAAFIEEYTTAGTKVQSFPMPTAVNGANFAFTCTGTSGNDGQLSRSQNRQYIITGGYTATPGTTSLGSSAATAIPRVVARIDKDGNIDTTTSLGSAAFSAGNCRWATSVDGTSFWVGGSNLGVYYATLGGGSVINLTDATGTANTDYLVNTRTGHIFNNQLYVMHGMGTVFTRVVTYGTGLQTTTASVHTPGNFVGPLSGNGGTGFYGVNLQTVSAVPDTYYVTNTNTIDKYCLVNGTWTMVGSVPTLGTNQAGYGIVAIKTIGSNAVDVYFVAGYTAANTIQHFRDNAGFGATPGTTANIVATAAANTAFRGLTVTPDTQTLAEVTSVTGKANGTSVNIAWSTSSEVQNAGFNLYRSSSPNGQFTKLNANIIPALGGQYAGASYSFNDMVPEAGTYYYQVEDVDTKGVCTLQAPIAVTAGNTPAPAPAPAPRIPVSPRGPRTLLQM